MKVKHNLRECAVFSGLADSDLDMMANLGVQREHEAGSTLFREGEAANELIIIQEGKVAAQLSVPAHGSPTVKRATVDIAQANDVLGWPAILEPHVHTITAVCLQKTRALAINGASLRPLLQANHSLGYALVNGLARSVASRLDDTRRLLVSERAWLP